MGKLVIAVDFDGTCVEHRYPATGRELPGCAETLRELAGSGHKLVLYSYRRGRLLMEAREWFAERNIPVHLPPNEPGKMLYHLFIEDRALGCPLKDGSVDWGKARVKLMLDGLIAFRHDEIAAFMKGSLLEILRDPDNWSDYAAIFRGAMIGAGLGALDWKPVLNLCLKDAGAVLAGICAGKGSQIACGGNVIRAEGLDTDQVLRDLCLQTVGKFSGHVPELRRPVDETCGKARADCRPVREAHDVGGGVMLEVSASPMWDA